jgi:YVTN family beta-propeller protein
VVAEIPTGQRPWGLAITPDGGKVYAACGGSDPNLPGERNVLTVIDTATNRAVRTIKVGDGPWGVAVGP